MIVVMMTDAVPKVAETNVVATSVAEMTVEEMSAEVVEMSGVAMSAEEIDAEEMTGAAIEIAGRNSKAVVGGGELLKLAPRLCRGYLPISIPLLRICNLECRLRPFQQRMTRQFRLCSIICSRMPMASTRPCTPARWTTS